MENLLGANMWSQQKQRRKENVFGSGCYDSMTLDGAHHLKLQQSASFTNAECIIFCRLPRQKCICMTLMHAQKVCETVTRILIFAYTNLKRIVDHTVPPHLKKWTRIGRFNSMRSKPDHDMSPNTLMAAAAGATFLRDRWHDPEWAVIA